jgi:ATP-dependent DNA helicase RecG
MNRYNPNHPWLSLDNRELLEKAGLWKTDYYSGQEGYTLAAALLLGKDEVIQNIVPHYKIDALVRIHNLDRYDDREYIQTNLIEAYEQLMAFVAKHLPDKFYLEGDQRVSLRTKIFREVVANLIVHREYTNAHPSTFIIYTDRVETENANNPHGNGPIDPNKFTPYPKNPTIAKFFIQLGRVEELGSGVLNVVRLIREYADTGTAQFIEGATFKMIIPVDADGKNEITVHDIVNDAASDLVSKLIDDGVNDGVIDGVNDGVKSELIRLVKTVKAESGIKANAIAHHLGKSTPTIERYLKIVRNLGLIEFKGSYKSGGYEVTEKLLTALSKKGL